MDERPLSERLRERCGPGRPITMEEASQEMGEPLNAVSRWVNLTVLPGPEKYAVIAKFLGISEFEVGGAIAMDAKARRRARLSR
jgi:hypothetical protein